MHTCIQAQYTQHTYSHSRLRTHITHAYAPAHFPSESCPSFLLCARPPETRRWLAATGLTACMYVCMCMYMHMYMYMYYVHVYVYVYVYVLISL